jgi:hypothetical protein
MTDDEKRLADMAEPEAEIATEQDQETDQPEIDEAAEVEGEQPEAEDKPKKETARERREREKAAKQRLRTDLEEAQRRQHEAEQKLARITEARKAQKPPSESDFDDHFEYVAAKAVYNSRQFDAERDTEAAAQEAEQARRQADAIRDREEALLRENWQAQRAEATERYADFDAVVGQPGLFPMGAALPALIQSSEMAADLAYHIASNRALHDALVSMTPVEVAREIGRLEARLSVPQPRKTTSAPDPISPVRGGSSSPVKDPMKLTADEYNAWRAAGGTFT